MKRARRAYMQPLRVEENTITGRFGEYRWITPNTLRVTAWRRAHL